MFQIRLTIFQDNLVRNPLSVLVQVMKAEGGAAGPGSRLSNLSLNTWDLYAAYVDMKKVPCVERRAGEHILPLSPWRQGKFPPPESVAYSLRMLEVKPCPDIADAAELFAALPQWRGAELYEPPVTFRRKIRETTDAAFSDPGRRGHLCTDAKTGLARLLLEDSPSPAPLAISTVNRGQKSATFLPETFETPHPRFNDGAKPRGGAHH